MSERRKRGKMVSIRLTEGEYKALAEKATAVEATVPAYIRELALRQKVKKPVMAKEEAAKLIRQVKAIGNNINQLTKLAHKEKISVVSLDKTKEALDNIWQSLSSVIRSQRLG